VRTVDHAGRYELKYLLPAVCRDEVLAAIDGEVLADSHAVPLPEGGAGYMVHSVYLDTPRLDDYFDRLDRRRVRNRLRVRTYGHPGERQPVFLENKRKVGRWVVKHRVAVTDADAWCSCEDPRPWVAWARRAEGAGRYAAESFCQLVEGGGRRPVTVVHYLREVFVPRQPGAGRVRLTLDRLVRAAPARSAGALFDPATVDVIPDQWMVMELKFDRLQPGWMGRLRRQLGVRAVPVTKFGLSVARSLRADRLRELELLTPGPLAGTRWVA
jgi:hypothetical protein